MRPIADNCCSVVIQPRLATPNAMVRIAALLFALLVAAQPMAASAQGRFGRGGPDMPFDPGGRGGDRNGGGQGGQGGQGGRGGGQTISMQQAVAIVSRRAPGRLLDASPAGSNYRIVWITPDGRRIDFIVDASSGAILSGG